MEKIELICNIQVEEYYVQFTPWSRVLFHISSAVMQKEMVNLPESRKIFLQLRAISTDNIIGDRDQKERQRRNEEGSKAGTFMSIRITSLAIRQEPRSFLCSTTIMRK